MRKLTILFFLLLFSCNESKTGAMTFSIKFPEITPTPTNLKINSDDKSQKSENEENLIEVIIK